MDTESKGNSEQVIHLGKDNSLAKVYMKELRSTDKQTDRMRFRNNIFRLGQIAAYEISRSLNYVDVHIETPLSESECKELTDQPVIATILRAGLPLFNGLLSYFDEADSAFISAYRKHDKFDGFEIEMTSISCPNINDRTIIVCDPMLATGQSLVKSINAIKDLGSPFQIIICTVIASEEGIAFVNGHFPNYPIYTFAIDPQLDAKSYIVPGLGDAGDLSFGPKIQE